MNNIEKDEEKLHDKIIKIQAGLFAIVTALVCGIAVFIATAWLLIKGGPNIGPHLQLLGQYFIGYTVSWKGCFIGMFYGAVIGGLAGWLIVFIYNRIVDIKMHS